MEHIYCPRSTEKKGKKHRKNKFEGMRYPHAIASKKMLKRLEYEKAEKKKLEKEKEDRKTKRMENAK